MSVLTCLHRPVGWWWGDLRCKTPTYECPVAHSAGAVEYSYCCNILTPHSYGHQRCVFLVLQGCSTGGLRALSVGFLYCILSPTGLVPKLHRGSRGLLRPGVAFPTTSRL